MSYATQLVLRLIHVLTGVFWAGSAFFLARFLLPAARASGASGDAVVQELFAVRKIGVIVPATAVLTVLSGFALYWRDLSANGAAWAQSRGAMAYGLGGVMALAALALGVTMVVPSVTQVVRLQLAAKAAGRELNATEAAAAGRLKKRAGIGNRLAAAALVLTVICMAVARYL